MALKEVVQLECNRQNRKFRQVKSISNFPESQFWSRGELGDFLIQGEANEMAGAVISFAQESLYRSLKPVIILDGTGTLEASLINLYTDNDKTRNSSLIARRRGKLRVYSPSYRGYDVLGNMDLFVALQFMNNATINRPLGNQITLAYINAFLETVNSVMPLSLNGIRELSKKTDGEIASIAFHKGIAQRHIATLRNPGQNGQNFRSFIAEMINAFSRIWNKEAGDNITTDINKGGIIYLNAQSPNPELFNKYFSTVLEYYSNTQHRLLDVILYGVTVNNNDGLLTHVKNAMKRSNETIGICYYNLEDLIRDYPFICGMPRQIIYASHGTRVPSELLKSYESYPFHYPKKVFSPGPNTGFFNFDWVIETMTKDRICLADLNGDHINKRPIRRIMKGYNGEEIAIVQNV